MRRLTRALNFRVFAIAVLIAVLATGCAQQRSLATTAEQDCYRRFSSYEYTFDTVFGLSAPSPRDITVAVIRAKQDQREIAFKAALKTFGEPATARLPIEAELAKAEAELTREKAEAELIREKAEAEAVNRKLDEIEARVEAGRAQMGECFGVGFSGKQAAERYARAKNAIADQRKFVTRDLGTALEKNRAAAERAAFVERWRADNIRHLKRKAGSIDLEIVEVARRESFGLVSTLVRVAATNTTSSTILRPHNLHVWGYDVHPELGGSWPIGTSLSDSFGNPYKLTMAEPRFYGTEGGPGIRPGETVVFKLEFADMPLENAKSVRISVEPGAYGQSQRAVFDIPAEAFFRGMVGHSQDHR